MKAGIKMELSEKEKEELLAQALKRKEAVKKQNEKRKDNYDKLTVTVPKGTKQQILDKGETVNGLINRLVLEWLDNN